MKQQISSALVDLAKGLERSELWLFLGWQDIRKTYSRSTLGPLWLTLSMGILVTALGVLYAGIFRIEIHRYLPFLAVGFIVWGLISGAINGACLVYSNAAGFIRQVNLPLSVHIYKFAWTQLILLAHNFIIYICVALIFRLPIGWSTLLFIPAISLIGLDIVFIAMILGPLCARFRDVPLLVASLVQIAFFVTPVMWDVSQIQGRSGFVALNPFYHFVEIARAPLLGAPPSAIHWGASLLVSFVLCLAGLFFYARCRRRIPYWC